MNLHVTIKNAQIFVVCKIDISQSEYAFALSKTFHMASCKFNGISVDSYTTEECTLPFRPPMIRYSFSNLFPGILTLEYSGELNGWYSFMQEEIYHFSMYNGWYPVGFDVVEEYNVEVHCNHQYELIHGKYFPDTGSWFYSTCGQSFIDCNIMLINKQKSKKLENEKISVWYFDTSLDETVKNLLSTHHSICQYYRTLYENDKAKNSTIVILPLKYPNGGAYQRDSLTVFADIRLPFERITHVLAHEIAHSYACGADCTSWEDWLNETHAEWSALLYLLSTNPALFEAIMSERETRFSGNYFLHPEGDLRPDHVHETGTMLYYRIFQAFGIEAIKTLLRTFDSLSVKDTKNFLSVLFQYAPALALKIKEYV